MVCPGGDFLIINAVARAVVVLQFRPFPDAYRLKEVRRTPQILLLAVIADLGQIVAVIQPSICYASKDLQKLVKFRIAAKNAEND